MGLRKVSELVLFKQDFVPNFCKESLSKSFKALHLHGWISSGYNGGYYLLPQLQRAVDKTSAFVCRHMDAIGGLRVTVPTLCKSSLLEQSNRWKAFPELFTLKDRRNNEFALSPTCEEGICHLVSSIGKPLPASRLPLLLYQVTTKFRDELHPRNGLLRGREFLMKDMYTFDSNLENAQKTYDIVYETYCKIFKKLGLNYFPVEGSVGMMGGTASHEFQVPSAAGENDILTCTSCKSGYSVELIEEREKNFDGHCKSCGGQLEKANGIEIGHTFLLGTRYSKAFNICYKNAENSNDLTWMGCFGIGVTRLVATCLEQMSSENNVKLPVEIAPYLGVVIPQKEGHRFDETLQVAERIAHQLSKLSNSDDFLFDDRHHLSIGKRLNDSHGSGIPLAIVAGKTALGETPMVEVYWRPGGASNSKYEKPLLTVSESDLLYQLRKLFQTVGVNI